MEGRQTWFFSLKYNFSVLTPQLLANPKYNLIHYASAFVNGFSRQGDLSAADEHCRAWNCTVAIVCMCIHICTKFTNIFIHNNGKRVDMHDNYESQIYRLYAAAIYIAQLQNRAILEMFRRPTKEDCTHVEGCCPSKIRHNDVKLEKYTF